MNYRIMIDISFEKEASARAVLKTAKDHIKNSVIINPGTPNEERGYIRLQECYHDEDPWGACQLIEEHLTPRP